MIVDPRTATAWTRTWNSVSGAWVTNVYQNTSIVVGAPPYNDMGFTVTVFGDVPVVSVRLGSKFTDPLSSFFEAVFDHDLDATWGKVPGGPADVVDAGDCDIGAPDFFSYNDFQGW